MAKVDVMLARSVIYPLRAATRGLLGSSLCASRRNCAQDTISHQPDPVENSLLTELLGAGLSTSEAESLLISWPRLVTERNLGKITKTYQSLLQFMPKNAAKDVLKRSPLIILKDADEIERINNYVANKMGVLNKEMTESKVFARTLEHVKARHLFLYRAGLYELPNYKGETKEIQNPKLKKIVDTSDAQFVRMTGLDIEEYQAFKNNLYLESENDGESELDMDEGDSEEGEQLFMKSAYGQDRPRGGSKKRRKR